MMYNLNKIHIMTDFKHFFNRLHTAVAVFSAGFGIILCAGCKSDPQPSPEIIGNWYYEFEDEYGGTGTAKYTFAENGDMIAELTLAGEQITYQMSWKVEGDKFYCKDKDDEKWPEDEETEWLSYDYKFNGDSMEFYDEDDFLWALTK